MQKIILGALLFVSVACKINHDPDASSEPTASIVSYFISEQYQFGSARELAAGLSGFYGRAMVATVDSTFAHWRQPPMGCRYAGNDVVAVSGTRALNIGPLILKDSHGFTVGIEPSSDQYIFQYLGLLDAGAHSLAAPGLSGTPAISQSFNVLASGANIVLNSSVYTAPEVLSSPKIPSNSGDPSNDLDNFYVGIARSADLSVSYKAPEGTSYVRATFSDGSSNAAYQIVCYGSPTGPIQVPAGAFSQFRATADGLLTIDFVSVSFRADISRIKESIVISNTRHIHGRKDIETSQGLQPVYFGALFFQ
jgi:hypothetical protein